MKTISLIKIKISLIHGQKERTELLDDFFQSVTKNTSPKKKIKEDTARGEASDRNQLETIKLIRDSITEF